MNIDYIAKKQVKNKRFYKIINSSFSIVGISNEMISKALEIENNDFEDTLQYLSAKVLIVNMLLQMTKVSINRYKNSIK